MFKIYSIFIDQLKRFAVFCSSLDLHVKYFLLNVISKRHFCIISQKYLNFKGKILHIYWSLDSNNRISSIITVFCRCQFVIRQLQSVSANKTFHNVFRHLNDYQAVRVKVKPATLELYSIVNVAQRARPRIQQTPGNFNYQLKWVHRREYLAFPIVVDFQLIVLSFVSSFQYLFEDQTTASCDKCIRSLHLGTGDG